MTDTQSDTPCRKRKSDDTRTSTTDVEAKVDDITPGSIKMTDLKKMAWKVVWLFVDMYVYREKDLTVRFCREVALQLTQRQRNDPEFIVGILPYESLSTYEALVALPEGFTVFMDTLCKYVAIFGDPPARGDDDDDDDQDCSRSELLAMVIQRALEDGVDDIIPELVNAEVDINRKDNRDTTPLLAAARMGYLPCMKALLAAGAVSLSEHGVRFAEELEAAVDEDQPESVALLLSLGVPVNTYNEDRMTPLMFAAYVGSLKCVEVLLAAGADVEAADADGATALILAVLEEHSACARTLIKAGANVNATDNECNIPIIRAAHNGDVGLIKALAAAGASIAATTRAGSTAMMVAAAMGKSPCVRALIALGADVEAVDKAGMTALMYAAINDRKLSVQALLDAGARLDAVDKSGKTALMHAAKKKATRCVKVLTSSMPV